MSKSDDEQRIIFRENAIRVGAGFVAKERPLVLDSLSTLGPHLGRWDPRDVDIDVSLQDRGGNEQRITLRTSAARPCAAGSGRREPGCKPCSG